MSQYASSPNNPWKNFKPHRRELPKAGWGAYALAFFLVAGLVGGLILLLREPEFVHFLILVAVITLSMFWLRHGGPFVALRHTMKHGAWWRWWW